MNPSFITKFVSIILAFNIFSLSPFSITFAQKTEVIFHPNPIVGFIEDNPVTFEDIRNKKIHDLSLKLYDELETEFISYSLKKLTKKYPSIQLTPTIQVSEKEILSIYEQNNLRNRGSLEQLKPQIKQFLENQILRQHYLKQYALAVEKGWITQHLKTPSNFLIEGNIKTAYLRGNKKASVILIEFSDYQCPFCGKIQTTINKLIDKYADRVAFGYRHFPLSFHREADEAAIATECAREQGKFEDMHLILYENQTTQTKKDLKKFARKIKIKSKKKFDKCLDSEKYRGLVNQDIKDGMKLGINGTPGFFLGYFNHSNGKISGEILSGALPYISFQQNIERYLKKKL